MLRFLILTIFILMSFSAPSAAAEEQNDLFIRDGFNDLDNWKMLEFPKIKEHTHYSIEREGALSYLRADSNASASGLVLKKEFNVFEYPKVRWRWKVSNVYKKGDAEKKSGDDYPLRVYIIFKYDPETASYGQKITYGLVKSIYGEYPPDSSLNYIWANRRHDKRIIPNPYEGDAMMIPLQSGEENAGRWIVEEIDIIKDYRAAFGEDPPVTGSLAIMNDSDNTMERSVSYIDFIEVYR